MDECGFSPSLPVSYSWTLKGIRKLVPFENPQGRRANAISVYLPLLPFRWIRWYLYLGSSSSSTSGKPSTWRAIHWSRYVALDLLQRRPAVGRGGVTYRQLGGHTSGYPLTEITSSGNKLAASSPRPM